MVDVWRRKISTLTIAAIGMGLLLCILAFIPFFCRTTLSNSNAQVNSVLPELSETLILLKNQVKELNEKLVAAEQQKKVSEDGSSFGGVKSNINPTVSPDESINPSLAQTLSKIGINKEVIVVLANSNVHPLLEIQFNSIKRVGISNYLVVALDDATVGLCKSNDVTFYHWDIAAGRSRVGSIVSALKFQILREFLQMGYNVLLTDTDVVFFRNPFEYLYRDSDVESMSDGYDPWSAYGYEHVHDDPEMRWSRYVYTTRIWAFNSGFFYIRPTEPAIELLDRVTQSLRQRPDAWDQAVYNEELFFPSHPGYVALTAAKRAMDIYLFMNSNLLFKTVRKDPDLRKQKPVIVHINYHPDKLPRMKATVDFYVNGKDDALDPFPDGTPRI